MLLILIIHIPLILGKNSLGIAPKRIDMYDYWPATWSRFWSFSTIAHEYAKLLINASRISSSIDCLESRRNVTFIALLDGNIRNSMCLHSTYRSLLSRSILWKFFLSLTIPLTTFLRLRSICHLKNIFIKSPIFLYYFG